MALRSLLVISTIYLVINLGSVSGAPVASHSFYYSYGTSPWSYNRVRPYYHPFGAYPFRYFQPHNYKTTFFNITLPHPIPVFGETITIQPPVEDKDDTTTSIPDEDGSGRALDEVLMAEEGDTTTTTTTTTTEFVAEVTTTEAPLPTRPNEVIITFEDEDIVPLEMPRTDDEKEEVTAAAEVDEEKTDEMDEMEASGDVTDAPAKEAENDDEMIQFEAAAIEPLASIEAKMASGGETTVAEAAETTASPQMDMEASDAEVKDAQATDDASDSEADSQPATSEEAAEPTADSEPAASEEEMTTEAVAMPKVVEDMMIEDAGDMEVMMEADLDVTTVMP